MAGASRGKPTIFPNSAPTASDRYRTAPHRSGGREVAIRTVAHSTGSRQPVYGVVKPQPNMNATAPETCSISAHALHGIFLDARYTPPDWLHNQYAVELWLQHAVEQPYWTDRRITSTERQTDVVLVKA